ncbi:MAG TPA: hypothetical protein VGE52_01955 [Pirellulales bacterium]
MTVAPLSSEAAAAAEALPAPLPGRRADDVIALFRRAVFANQQTPGLKGNVVELAAPEVEDVFVSADLHGNWTNYWAILERADLDRHPKRHLVLQEVCHGGPKYKPDACASHAMLEAVADLKLRYPDRVHFLLSNHELSELTGHAIRKDGRMVLLSFLLGVHHCYGAQADSVHSAYTAFIASCPLAIRIARDVFVTHSIPDAVDELGFDVSVFDRPATHEDVQPRGPIFDLVWGRDYRVENAQAFARLVAARLLIHGHTPCDGGCSVPNAQQIILDCSNTPAACLLVPTSRVESMDELLLGLQPLGESGPPSSHVDSSNSSTPSVASAIQTKLERRDILVANLTESLQEAMKIDGALAAAVVDGSSGMCLGAIGNHVDLEVAAAGNSEVIRAKMRVMSSLKIDDKIEDILITLGKEYHIIRLMKRDAGLFLYMIFRRESANLALARHKLAAIEKDLAV